MNVFEQVALGWQCLWHARHELPRAELWGPWVAMLVVQSVVIGALAFAAHPALSWWMVPLLRAVTHEDVVRFPELLRRLPGLAAQVAVVLGWVLGSLTAGAATRQFADRFAGAGVRSGVAWREALSRWPSLLLVALPVALVGWIVRALPGAIAGVRMSSISRRLLPELLSGAELVLVASLLYTTALVMIERCGAFAALREVPRTWARGFVPALVVVLLVSLLRMPINRLALSSALIVDRGVPELAVALALVQAAVGVLAGFLLTGSATLLYLSALTTREEDSW
ncbi:MAG: hypothetical protein ABIU54_08090 [Candidatus Eisenbacteria bacterium]